MNKMFRKIEAVASIKAFLQIKFLVLISIRIFIDEMVHVSSSNSCNKIFCHSFYFENI